MIGAVTADHPTTHEDLDPTPPAAGIVSVATPEAVALTFPLAGLGSRGLALAFDGLLLAALSVAEFGLWALASLVLGATGAGRAILPWVTGAFIGVAFLTVWGYFIIGEAAGAGRTPGKRRAGIRVVRQDGSRIGLVDAIIRNLLRLVDVLPGSWSVGVVSILVTRKAQRLGDLAAGTIVVADSGTAGSAVPVAADPLEQLVHEYLERRSRLAPEADLQVRAAILAAYDDDAAGRDAAAAMMPPDDIPAPRPPGGQLASP